MDDISVLRPRDCDELTTLRSALGQTAGTVKLVLCPKLFKDPDNVDHLLTEKP